MTVVGAFVSSDVQTTDDDNSDHTQRKQQQAARNPYDDVTGHVHHVTFYTV